MQFIQKISVDKRCNAILSVLIVFSGVFLHLPIWHFKYLYMICAGCVSALACIKICLDGSIKSWIKENWVYLIFVVYLFLLVTVKKLIQIRNGTMDSIITGYGEPLYALFALLFFGAFSKKKIKLFMLAFVGTYVVVYSSTGFYSLYDVGNVCRSISLYENPNILSVYAVVSLAFSILLAVQTLKPVVRCFFALCGALSVSAIINSSSRAMYLGIVAAALLFVAMIIYFRVVQKRRFRLTMKFLPYICVFLAASAIFIYVYRPLPERAIINLVEDENVQETTATSATESENLVDSSLQTTPEPENQETAVSNSSVLFGVDRITNDEDLTITASATENIRFFIWKTYLDRVSLDTFWGSDPGTDTLYFEDYGRDYAPHNVLIYMLFLYGVPGLFLFLLLLIYFAKAFFTRKTFSVCYSVAVLCFFALLVYGMFHTVSKDAVFWCIVGLLKYVQQYGEGIKDFHESKKDSICN